MGTGADVVVLVTLPDGSAGAFPIAQVNEARQRAEMLGFGPKQSSGRSTTPAATERLLTSQEMAQQLGSNDTLVEQMARDRRIPSIRVGRLLRFEPAAVLAALRANGTDS